jgi:hypothetical protein
MVVPLVAHWAEQWADRMADCSGKVMADCLAATSVGAMGRPMAER